LESSINQPQTGSGGLESRIDLAGDVKREVHRAIEKLRLALSKKDFCGRRDKVKCQQALTGNLRAIATLVLLKDAKLFVSSGFAPPGPPGPLSLP
jgi:hypothetical protein